ncbi:MAG: tetratricopeptide repeat protein [Candidatus Limnocylindria bacterium]
MPEVVILVIGLLVAGAFVIGPMLGPNTSEDTAAADDLAATALRHRVALESLRDVESDRRAGSLDDAAYKVQRAEAEDRAAATLAAMAAPRPAAPRGPSGARSRRTMAMEAAAVVAALLVVGSLAPATGIANRTEVNEPLAASQAAEAARRDRIDELLEALRDDPSDPQVVSDLADAYLAGSSPDDLVRAAASLQLLIGLEPTRADAYERIMAAYLRAGDGPNARAAHDSYAALPTVDPVEEAFFDGLIAVRGENDPARARAAFDRFLDLAPDDPRAGMIRGLRDEAESASLIPRS